MTTPALRRFRPVAPTTSASTRSPSDEASGGDARLESVAAILERHAENPSAFLALNAGTRHFTVPGVDGVIAYRAAGRSTLVQLGGVFADASDQPVLLAEFLDFARVFRRRVVAVQLMRQDAELYARHAFTVNQIGADYVRELAAFDLKGKKHMQLRNKLSRARRAGVRVVELPTPVPASPAAELDEIDRRWLRSKGRHVKELQFMVGQRGGAMQYRRRLFVAQDEAGAAAGYVSFAPVYGSRSGWLHDLSRRRPDAPPGVLELIVVTAVDAFRSEGVPFVHFGFTPFTNLSDGHELPCASPLTARLARFLNAHGSALYPAADQLAYKAKWAPDVIQPEYIAFQGGISAAGVWQLLRLTNAV